MKGVHCSLFALNTVGLEKQIAYEVIALILLSFVLLLKHSNEVRYWAFMFMDFTDVWFEPSVK